MIGRITSALAVRLRMASRLVAVVALVTMVGCIDPTEPESDKNGGNGGGGGGGSDIGRVTFWTRIPDGGSIDIYVENEYVGALTQYFPNGAPSCTQSTGVVAAYLDEGTYEFSAYDDAGRSWSGYVTAVGDGCSTMELTL